MNWTRLLGLALALGLHGLAVFMVYSSPLANALAEGKGSESFNVVATVSLETADLITQEAHEASAEATPSPPSVEPPKETEAEKPEPEVTPLPQEVPEKVVEEPKTPTQMASVASEAQEAQRASAAEAARRSQLWSVYQKEIYSLLERHKVHVAKYGDVLLTITIAPSGKLLSRTVAQSSGIAEIDGAAIAALERSAPFPAFSPDVSSGPLTLSVPFRFRVR
ncbi:MAG: TonB family protein [Rhodomicrobium sp.]